MDFKLPSNSKPTPARPSGVWGTRVCPEIIEYLCRGKRAFSCLRNDFDQEFYVIFRGTDAYVEKLRAKTFLSHVQLWRMPDTIEGPAKLNFKFKI